MTPRIVVIAGPTASGKTASALALARRVSGELVGCDSVQVYRGFDIGSAKPTPEELGGIPHHMLDVVDPDQPIDAMRYAELADESIRAIVARGRVPIVVGGTGLWLRALLRGLVDLPAPDPAIRARLVARAHAEGTPALHEHLREIDPRAAAMIHPNDELRIVRALEVFEQVGRPLGELRADHALGAPRYRALGIALDRPRDDLYARIDARIDAMLAAGWLDETRALIARWGRDVRALGSVGYRELAEHLAGPLGWEACVARIRRSTRVYTRRQRTFLGSLPDVAWRVHPDELASRAGEERIDAFLSAPSRG